MSKISLDDLDKYSDETSVERFKKKPKVNQKKKKEKPDKRKGFVDLSTIDWEDDSK